MEVLVPRTDALIAQWIEHSTPTRKVAGSTPVERAMVYKMSFEGTFFILLYLF